MSLVLTNPPSGQNRDVSLSYIPIYNVPPMTRRFLWITASAAGFVILVLFAAVTYALLQSRPEPEDDMQRAKALVETEHYLSALQVLRAAPTTQKNGAEAHSYLGAAYLQLHLYKAAIDEFEQA